MLVSQSAGDLNGNDAWHSSAHAIAKLENFMWEADSGVVRIDLRSRGIFGFLPDEDVTDKALINRLHRENLPSVYAESMAAVTPASRLT